MSTVSLHEESAEEILSPWPDSKLASGRKRSTSATLFSRTTNPTPEEHRKLTGTELAPVLSFAKRLAALNRPVWLRYVLVPGYSDNLDDIAQLARFCRDLGNIQRVNVLPFHQMGRFKWKELKLDYTMADVIPPSRELVQKACDLFRAEGLKAY